MRGQEIINGKVYNVIEDVTGQISILGDPQRDLADKIGKATADANRGLENELKSLNKKLDDAAREKESSRTYTPSAYDEYLAEEDCCLESARQELYVEEYLEEAIQSHEENLKIRKECGSMKVLLEKYPRVYVLEKIYDHRDDFVDDLYYKIRAYEEKAFPNKKVEDENDDEFTNIEKSKKNPLTIGKILAIMFGAIGISIGVLFVISFIEAIIQVFGK